MECNFSRMAMEEAEEEGEGKKEMRRTKRGNNGNNLVKHDWRNLASSLYDQKIVKFNSYSY